MGSKMNEQITKLADKAIEDMPGAWNIPDEFCEKFAELIVRECSGFRNELGIALCSDPSALHRYFGVDP